MAGKPNAERRAAIGDAALRVLAHGGGRALTHRAVDAEASLPPGSVSYYARTRQALVACAAESLFAQDAHVAEAALGRAADPATPERVAQDLGAFVRLMTAEPHRHRVVARYELLAEAQRAPELAEQFRAQRSAFVDLARRALRRVGAPATGGDADALVSTLDGLLHRQVMAVAEPLPEDAVERTLRGVLFALSGDGPGTAPNRTG
ncbi:TetR family transcriptional regulator [Actinokineospora sp. PR83]|uniref:TetR/AcrR family transcriptional regulator n=1 Tax=Actinokineospora sp. PR83 TaxID=2884908 RepID=UPI0027E109D3|nr:TetR/AcrR family transcriptional regulator [Actinokineospora sp. PR83]MCG8917341.1 TetR family transcriptional regulator [Actinokineospora sp. PR83]